MRSLKKIAKFATRVWRDDRGAEGLEKLLIIAALVLPLLAVLIFFGEAIKDWLTDGWGTVQGDSDTLRDTRF